MRYKTAALSVLLLLSVSLYAAHDVYLALLPGNAVKKAEKVYAVPLDFDGAVKKIAQRIEQDPEIRSDNLIKENGFRVYAFYNLRGTGGWHRLFVIEEEGKVTVRFF